VEDVNVAASVTRFKGSPVAARALLRREENGGVAVGIVDSVLSWEVPAADAAMLTPFLEATERRLDVDRATDPNKTILNFTFVDDAGKKTISVVLTRGQRVSVA